jgi:hypothetical protein
MKTVLKSLTMAALIAAVATPAQAQQKSWGFGLFGSWVSPGSLAEAEPSDNDLKLDEGWSGGASLEKWFGSRRMGLRFEGNYMKQPFVLTRGENTVDDLDEDEEEILDRFTGVNTWFADANLMLRLLPASVDRRFAPFLSLGTGLIHWDTGRPETDDARLGRADAYIYGESQTEWALTGGIGADIFFSETVALRLEARDYWNSDSPYLVLSDMERDHEGGHNVLWRAGLQFNFGGARVEEPGFVAAPPPPAPAPAPVVAAPAPPATETVAMCVVDSNGRLQTVQAKRYIETGQIYVTRNGQEVAFSTVYPVVEPNYVRGASWYVASRPLILNLDEDDMGGDLDDEIDDALEQPENRVEFVNFGARGPVVMGDVMYVGSIDGTPLYAKISDVGAIRTELNDRLRTTTDLGDILDDEEFADRFVNEIETFYLAIEPAAGDCIFQPVSSTRVVRRTNG